MSSLRAILFATLLFATTVPGEAAQLSTADVVTLRDGKSALGEVREYTPRAVLMVVRREWARQAIPDSAKRWEAAERFAAPRVMLQRRERLNAWRRDRTIPPILPASIDRITPWLDNELAKLKDGGGSEVTPLMLVRLTQGEFTKVTRKPKGTEGLLRQAWLSKFHDPELMPVDAITAALEGRGFDATRPLNPSVDALLPPQTETDSSWLTRRAATEIVYDPNLRLLQYQGMLMVEPGNGGGNPAMSAIQALPALAALLGQSRNDQLPVRLRMLSGWGRVGAMVTKLEVAPDFSSVEVEITLMVHAGSGRWQPAGSRRARVRPEDLGGAAGRELADDPQVASVFRLIEAIGLMELSPEIKQRSLAIGSATSKALGMARAECESDLSGLAFPVLNAPAQINKP